MSVTEGGDEFRLSQCLKAHVPFRTDLWPKVGIPLTAPQRDQSLRLWNVVKLGNLKEFLLKSQ